MRQTKHFREFLLLLVNRGAVPLSVFVALAYFQRKLQSGDFESFLLAFSLTQWILAFGFQWQKNAAVRLYHRDGYRRISLIALVVVMVISAVFYVMFAQLTNMALLIGGLFYTLVAGALYYVSTNYRMWGSVSIYANTDTAFQVIRWAAAVVAVMALPVADAPFWGAASAVCVALGVFGLMTRRRATVGDGPSLTWRVYLGTGLWLATFDFSGAGMMYIDRFYVHDADYILHSTVSSQIGSVLFGALVAATYPRIMLSWREGGHAWRGEYRRMVRFVVPLLIITPLLCIAVGPILLRLLSPGAHADLRVLAILGISQSFHHMIYLASIVLILLSRNYICAAAYAGCFTLYTCVLAATGNVNWLFVAGTKCVFLLAALAVVGVTTLWVARKAESNVSPHEGYRV